MKKVKDVLKINVKLDSKKLFSRISKSPSVKKAGIYCGIGIVFLAFLVVLFNLVYANKIYPKVYIGGVNFGGLSRDEAKTVLNDLISKNTEASLNYQFEGTDYSKKISDFDVNYRNRFQSTLDSLFGVGRSGSLGKIIADQFRSVFSHNDSYAVFEYDKEKLNNYVGDLAKAINIESKDAEITISDGQAKVTAEQIGREFNIDTNNSVALKTIGSFAFAKPTPFEVKNINPEILTAGANKALPELERLLGLKLILKAGDKEFGLTSKETTDLIALKKDHGDLVPEIDKDKTAGYLDQISSQINQEAKDAKFTVESGRVVTFQMSQTGYELDKEDSINKIIAAYKDGQTPVELTVKTTQPLVSDDAATNGVSELIGEGHTSWRGSPPNRIHNLQNGAAKISGTLVQPGQEFSTIHALAPITFDNGYLKELVIKNGNRVEPDIGGGLCQVSSTLFRAVLHSGLKITARTPHSFRVSYYEPPVGMDATVYDPAPDFKFINNYSTPVLIWAVAGSNELTFQIFGTKDGRQIDISDPVVGGYVSPGDPIYTESDTVAPGVIRQVERATPGATASFNYKVTSAKGEVLQEETYVSKYIPVPNSYLYGPGTTGIPGQEAAPVADTPTPTPIPVKTKK